VTNLPSTHFFASRAFDTVINLAAQAGVRYSLEHPETYIDSNVSGFLHILEGCRHHHIPRLIFASSSSVYGNSTEVPFREDARAVDAISGYALPGKSFCEVVTDKSGTSGN